ncbi:sulfite exporter TauE/SafE family protein [Crateriforma spongiae]|uniref:sulfite exporter TauE/SafE family protein n=1 Tax=Crateriforma spongiae TaxID=2724528 RepID=UPI001445C170|nr:sulfite exporter TauE/SafE family protein [Crateriforma spongiae]
MNTTTRIFRTLFALAMVMIVTCGATPLQADDPTSAETSMTTRPVSVGNGISKPMDNPNLNDIGNGWVIVIAVVALIAFAAGFVHSGIGFGFGIVAIGLMPLVIDARQTHLLVSLCAVPVQMGTVWAYRKGVVWRPLLFALAGALIGLPLGLWLFHSINLDWLTRGTGVALLLMIGYSFHNRKASRNRADSTAPQSTGGSSNVANDRKDAGGATGIGVASGFLMGAVTMPGPPVVAYALQRDWDQEQFKAFVNQFLLALSVFKILGLLVSTEISRQSTIEALLLIPAALLGIAIGKRFSTRLSAGGFRTMVAVGLAFVAVLLIAKGAG